LTYNLKLFPLALTRWCKLVAMTRLTARLVGCNLDVWALVHSRGDSDSLVVTHERL